MTDRRRTTEHVEKVVADLMKSHSQLMKGVGGIVVDYALLNDCRLAGQKLITDLRLGEIRVERWAPPKDEETESEDDIT